MACRFARQVFTICIVLDVQLAHRFREHFLERRCPISIVNSKEIRLICIDVAHWVLEYKYKCFLDSVFLGKGNEFGIKYVYLYDNDGSNECG